MMEELFKNLFISMHILKIFMRLSVKSKLNLCNFNVYKWKSANIEDLNA